VAILAGIFLLPTSAANIEILSDVSFAVLALMGGVLFVGISVIGGFRLWRAV
jgi:hypothetical protein